MRTRTKICMTCGELYVQKGKFTEKCSLCINLETKLTITNDDHYIITPIIPNDHSEYRSKVANIDNNESLESAKRFYAITGYCEHFEQFQENGICKACNYRTYNYSMYYNE